MNLTNGSANFFSEIESNLLLVSLSSISYRGSFPGQKVSLGTPGRSQVLVVWSSTLHRIDDKRTLSSGENVRCRVAKKEFVVVFESIESQPCTVQ